MITKDLIRKKLDEALALVLEEKCSEVSDNILEAVDIHSTEHHIDKMVHHASQAEKHQGLINKSLETKGSVGKHLQHVKNRDRHEAAYVKHKAIVQKHHDELVKQIATLKRAK